jgi:hypothetical protein
MRFHHIRGQGVLAEKNPQTDAVDAVASPIYVNASHWTASLKQLARDSIGVRRLMKQL